MAMRLELSVDGEVIHIGEGDLEQLQTGLKEFSACEFEANARLITAAPALLDALKGIIDIGFVPEGPRWKKVLRACEAAIAQAKGE